MANSAEMRNREGTSALYAPIEASRSPKHLTPVLVQQLHWSFRECLGEVVPGFLMDKADLFQAYVPPLARVFLQLQEVNRCWLSLLSRSTKENCEAPCTSKVSPWPA